jgi:predicted Ser/Thr protein kinase
MGPNVGDRFGPYLLVEELGRGGMGVVFRAREESVGRDVALKILKDGEDASEQQIERFRAEAQALAQLGHAGFVRVMNAGVHAGFHFVVMEVVDGESLGDRLDREGPLPVREALAGTQQVAEALAHAHERGIVHRDLKPGNVLAHRDGRWLVTDFGLVRDLRAGRRLTQTGQVLGTPAFMPPEQAQGAPDLIDPRSDVYALGATLFALLTGRAPFSGAPVQVVVQVLRNPPPPPSRFRPEVDANVDAVVLKCMAKERALRYRDMQELAKDLGQALGGLQTDARRQQLRRSVRMGLIVWAAASLLAAGGWLVWRGTREAPPPPPTAQVRATPAPPPTLTLSVPRKVVLTPTLAVDARVEGVARTRELRCNERTAPLGEPLPLDPGRNAITLSAVDDAGERHATEEVVVWRLVLPDGFHAGAEEGEVVCARDGSVLVFHPPGRMRRGWDQRDEKLHHDLFGHDSALLEDKLESRKRNELPAHDAELTKGFLLGKYEVTWSQYETYCDRIGRRRPPRQLRESPSFQITDDMPVANVQWGDAKRY